MSSRALQSTTTSLLFIILAVMDTLVLWFGLLRQWLIYAFAVKDIRILSGFTCKAHTFLVYWISHLASWMLVSIACERCIVVFCPFRAKHISTKRNAVVCLFILAFVLLVINMQLLWTIELTDIPTGNNTFMLGCKETNYQYFALHIWPWIDCSLLSLAPFAILAVANLSIVAKLLHHNYERNRKLNKHAANSHKVGSLTFVNFAVSAWFLITTLPISVFLIKQHVWVEDMPMTRETAAITHLRWAVAANVSYLNNSFNFVLYIMTSRRFRNELIALLRRKRSHQLVRNDTV